MKTLSFTLALIFSLFALAPVWAQCGAESAGETEGESVEEADAVLESTLWKLSMLGTAEIEASPRQPHMTLNPEQHSASGNGGCNGFGGSYRLEGDKLSFSQFFSTMMYCEGLMETEQGLFDALERCAGFLIEGRELTLVDSEGAALARFEAAAASSA